MDFDLCISTPTNFWTTSTDVWYPRWCLAVELASLLKSTGVSQKGDFNGPGVWPVFCH